MGDAERRRRRLRHHGEVGMPDGEAAAGRTGRHEPADTFADGPTASTAAVHDDSARSRRGVRRAEPELSDDGSRSRRGVRRAELELSEPRGRRGGPAAEEGERGLRGLVGSGSSQVSVTAALRARDAARPTDADLAEAEARVVLVRRNWVPREELPRPNR
ncbi:hypothetical protein [Micromonospora sp. MP36]|uniref:hypothetical protein n=1 Tax=unclassified Micromonospora TaxID=2617518 RepID=UPI0011D45278|nr:hypothetical protein FXF52_13700 [Micromonospora sp. MP36]